MKALPHAFDGTSATESGALALVSLVVAVTVVFVGLRIRPHAWAIVVAGGMLLLLALAMVTVTLASTGENRTPPDGALLVPYLLPGGLVLLALGIAGRAGRCCGEAAARGASPRPHRGARRRDPVLRLDASGRSEPSAQSDRRSITSGAASAPRRRT